MWRPLALLLLILAAPAVADTVLQGAFEQGGLVLGRTDPENSVSLDGRPLRVAADGSFVFGFGRDAAATALLAVRTPDGRREERVIEVRRRAWSVQRIDGLPEEKVTPDPQRVERIRAEAALVAERRKVESARMGFRDGFSAPAEGRISGVFGSQRILNGAPRAPHSGTDVAAAAGAPVHAAAAGVVTLAHPDLFFTGKTVMIDHGHGLSSVYAHLSEIAVREGQAVAKGQRLGRVGASGRATGPHLHWGVSWFDERLDPETVLKVTAR
jgi:murein DD-endopeptidase MepM/ murein hydrolase activator NlpD